MQEIWKPAKGYEGYLEVSNAGKVRSVDRVITVRDGSRIYQKPLKGHIKSQHKNKQTGYMQVGVWHKTKNVSVHRLVAETFIPNPQNLPQVNHKNSDRTDNRVENLEWCSCRENNIHGLYSKEDPRLRPCVSLTSGKKYRSQAEAARDIGDCQANISRSCRTGIKVKGQRFVYAACAGEIDCK